MKIALFLGAGASAPYGMPTTKDLWDRIRGSNPGFPRKDLLDPHRFPDVEHVLSVLDQLITFAGSRAGKLYAGSGGGGPEDKSDGTLEHIFTVRNIRKREACKIIASAFKLYVGESRNSKKIIEKLMARSYKWNPSSDKDAEKILRPLFDLARSEEGHVTVFTTNYDTVIEEYCAIPRRRIECIDGFNLHDARRTLVWDGRFVPRNDDFPTKVFLYKLHGSMNWVADADGDRGLILQKPDTGASDDRARDMYIRPSLDAGGGAVQREPYAAILREFRKSLPSFNACIVIGYSFRDPDISKELVKFAGSGRILIVLSPTATSDFENNALKGAPPTGEKGKWRGNDAVRVMELGPEDVHGGVCAINGSLDAYIVDGIIDVIKSIIEETTSGRRVAAGGR